MTPRVLLIAGAALGIAGAPALAGGDCGYGSHAVAPQTVVDAPQATPENSQAVVAIPYPMPTLAEETDTAAVETDTSVEE